MIRRPPRSTLFPSTPLSRSAEKNQAAAAAELRTAAHGFDAVDMAVHAAAARRQLGRLLAGDEGAGLMAAADAAMQAQDRKSTRLNSSHSPISYAVFCLEKKK